MVAAVIDVDRHARITEDLAAAQVEKVRGAKVDRIDLDDLDVTRAGNALQRLELPAAAVADEQDVPRIGVEQRREISTDDVPEVDGRSAHRPPIGMKDV